MNCPECGEPNPAKYNFCPICGASIRTGEESPAPVKVNLRASAARPGTQVAAEPVVPAITQKDHLFETVKNETSSARQYARLLAVVVAAVVVTGLGVFYITLPDVGDRVRPPAGLEMAIRDHFLLAEKRNATDIETYYCGDFYWARVRVETRSDIPNPLLRIGTYTARAILAGGPIWSITATPITSPEIDTPCR